MAITQWTDFEGLKKIYEKDWDFVQNLDKSITKAEHIKEHVLPQFEELYNNHNKFFPQKLAYKRMIDYLNGLLLELDNYDNSILTITEQERPETLSDLITHKKNVEIVESIKIQYKNIKGKRLKLLMLAFQDLGLLPRERIAQKFYKCCKKEFSWEIASYNAMNGYIFNNITDNDDFEMMKNYLETIIKTN